MKWTELIYRNKCWGGGGGGGGGGVERHYLDSICHKPSRHNWWIGTI